MSELSVVPDVQVRYVEATTMLLGAKEVAALLSVSERTAIRMFQSGALKAFQVNGHLWRTRREIVDAYIARELGEPVRKPQQVAAPVPLRRVA